MHTNIDKKALNATKHFFTSLYCFVRDKAHKQKVRSSTKSTHPPKYHYIFTLFSLSHFLKRYTFQTERQWCFVFFLLSSSNIYTCIHTFNVDKFIFFQWILHTILKWIKKFVIYHTKPQSNQVQYFQVFIFTLGSMRFRKKYSFFFSKGVQI